MSKTKLKKSETMKPFIVAVFDNRFPALAMRNVRVLAEKNSQPDQVADKALALVYTDEAIKKQHCTHVQVFDADLNWHVLDGNSFKPVVYHEEKQEETEHA